MEAFRWCEQRIARSVRRRRSYRWAYAEALAASYIQIEAGQINTAAGVRLLGVCDVAGRQYAPASKLAAGTYIVTFMPTQGAQKPMSVKIIVPVR